jgi:beta-glucanase (GH16 family)
MRKIRIVRLGGTVALAVTIVAIGSISPGSAAPKRAYAQTAPTLVWSEEFNGPSIDTSSWGFEQGYIRNGEQQYYTSRPENARIENGNLVIEARRENYNGYAYTSASLTTQGKRQFQYGRFEMRAKIPTAWGAWPAWWGLGGNVGSPPSYSGWPHSGEIDMMEYYRSTLLYNVMDSNAQWFGTTEPVPAGFGNDYHTWVMDWSSSQINLYLDGVLKRSYNVDDATVNGYNPFRQPWFLIANLAIGGSQGGDPSGTAFPLRYYIDYIRVYQDSGGGTTDYRIANRNSRLLMEVSGGSTADGAQVIQWPATGGANQDWRFVDKGSGYWSLVNRNSGKCLDVSGYSTADGAKVIQWTCNGGNNQQWKQIWLDSSHYELQARHSGKCLDVPNWSTSAGAQLNQWTCNGGANQQWSN